MDPAELLPSLLRYETDFEVTATLRAGNPSPAPEHFPEGAHALVRNADDYVSLCEVRQGQFVPLRNAIGG